MGIICASFESGQDITNLDIYIQSNASVGDKLLLHSFNVYTGGYEIFPSRSKVINNYGWCSPHP